MMSGRPFRPDLLLIMGSMPDLAGRRRSVPLTCGFAGHKVPEWDSNPARPAKRTQRQAHELGDETQLADTPMKALTSAATRSGCSHSTRCPVPS